MKKKNLPKPTEAELAILAVLWQHGPSTVREVWEQISPKQETGYTTVLKTMQIMFEKGRSNEMKPSVPTSTKQP